MRQIVLSGALLLALTVSARASEEQVERVREAVSILADGDAERAVEILTAVAEQSAGGTGKGAASQAVNDAIVQLALGVALGRTGRTEESRSAYEGALAARDGGEAAGRALYNFGTSHLAEAFAAAETLRDPENGANVEPAARMQIAQRGLKSTRAAIRALRDRVRAVPTDRDAAHNLQIAQRTRRFLEEELRRQQEEQQQSGEPGDGEEGDEQEKGEPQEGDESQDGDDAQQEPQDGDEQSQQQSEESEGGEGGEEGDQQEDGAEPQPSGSEGSDDADGEQPPPEQGVAGSGDEAEDDPLKDLLEAAARRLRLIEEMRKSKMRRVRVEKDW